MSARILIVSIAVSAVMAGCIPARPVDPRESPGGAALAIGEPPGGESAPIAGRVDLPPQQPRR